MKSLPTRIADSSTTSVVGVWQRHVAARYAHAALSGRTATSRWGTVDGFPVLHLGQPLDSVIVEAYRHLVDPVEDPSIAHAIPPRVLVTCQVDVTNILDLRTATSRVSTGLTMEILQSGTRDGASYRKCQEGSATAHQLGMHGVIAPAATELGLTLALFPEHLPDTERPVLLDQETWSKLPADPRGDGNRGLRLIK